MIKDFLKNISIYGILPVVGKFMNLLLIPLYAHYFSPEEFGVIDIIDVLIFFLLIITVFEIPTALGRYFFDNDSSSHQRKIISTGLFMVVFFTTIITVLLFIFGSEVLYLYIGSDQYLDIYNIALVWLYMMSINTYMSFIPRYQNKSRLYVIVSLLNVLFKLLTAILFVVFLDQGIKGVFYGYITGSTISLVIYTILSKDLIGMCFSKKYCIKMIRYAYPLIGGILIAAIWIPVSRYYIASYFPLSYIGLFSFATRIASINALIYGALAIAWKPLLFEKKDELLQNNNLKKISAIMLMGTLLLGSLITLLSPELTIIIGTEKYKEAALVVGFIVMAGILKILSELQGFAPYIKNNTYLITLANITSLVVCMGLFLYLKSELQLIGIGLIMIVFELIKYLILVGYTKQTYKIKLYYKWEIILVLGIILSQILIILEQPLVIRISCAILIGVYSAYIAKKYGIFSKITNRLRFSK